METITPLDAKSRGMRSITFASPLKSPFIQSVIKAMKADPDTEWALVGGKEHDGEALVEVYRVPSRNCITSED